MGDMSDFESGAVLIDPSALCEAGARTARFGERSEYEGSRAPASHSALHEETTQ